jgi:ubiquinone/menaquinone biosynthesis C-methylase UbiE
MTEARLDKGRVPDTYRRIASVYDAWAWLTERKARKLCLDLASIRDGESVLEVAVGTGLAFESILKANPSGRNEGIDLTDAMLARAEHRAARSGNSNYRLRVGDAYALDFSDDSFDVVINNYMFDLLPSSDFRTVLDEFRRVLRPGGRLVMVNMTQGERWYNGLWQLIYRVSPALLGGCRGVRVSSYLIALGFDEVERTYISQATFPSEVIAARLPP